MSRLSIELTTVQHQRVKAIAALQGQSIKDYVLERVLSPLDNSDSDAEQALLQLEAFMQPRLAEAEAGNVVNQSVESIFRQVGDKLK
ncbi:MAG: antitoxin [Psychrosphaera sp.]|nr:antitoxin [Psychrosphaera sp.]